jgi:putative phage-type endonuclease
VTALRLRQGTPEWIEGRRSLVTGTDIPVLLGISPWKCEADLADEKLGIAPPQESTLRMRIGSALEDMILDEYTAETGRRARRYRLMVRHPEHPWAAASPDAGVIGERRLVELKWTGSRIRFADGLPPDVEAQVAWQLGCTGYPVADVAVMTAERLTVSEQAADPALFADLLAVAEDFRRRLAAGGPFARDGARVRRDYPADNGTEITPDPDVLEAVRALIDIRSSRKRLEDDEDRLMSAIQARMGDAAAMRGPGWQITWKRTKDRTDTDWKSLASGLLNALSETDRQTVVGLHSTVKPGFRPFRLSVGKETE